MAGYMKSGKCTNFSSGDQKGCPKADANEIIEVDITDDFVCPHCHSELMEVAPKKKGIPAWIWGIVVAVVLGGGGAYFAFSGDKAIPVESITLEESYTLTEGESLFLEAVVTPDNATDKLVLYSSSDEKEASLLGSELTAGKAGKATITAATADGTVTTTAEVTVKAKRVVPQPPQYPTVGTFSGRLKNGYPHGTGTLTFKSQRLIDAHDEKARVAQAGDYLIGEWDNGHLVQARWYDSSNNLKETIVLGKAMNPEKDHPLGRFSKQ